MTEKLRSFLTAFSAATPTNTNTIINNNNAFSSSNTFSKSTSTDCTTVGSNRVCNVLLNNISGGTFVGKRNVNDTNRVKRDTATTTTRDEPVFIEKRDVNRHKRQWQGNTANVNAQVISGGSFVGKRNAERVKRQFLDNTANVFADVVNGGHFMGKRQVIANNKIDVIKSVLDEGVFIGKRDAKRHKRQLQGNTANVNAQVINGGSFVGKRNAQREKRNVANLMANRIQGATFSGQANVMDASFNGMTTKCDSTGCVNVMG